MSVFTVRRAALPHNGATSNSAGDDDSDTSEGTSMQTQGFKRFLAVPIAALAIGAALLATPHSAFADQRDFTLVNRSGQTIRSVYVSAASHNSWEEDVLGRDVLRNGHRVRIHFSSWDRDSGLCHYDIRVITRDGSEGTKWGVNLCHTSTVVYD
jgi:hypothetical protein